MGCDKFCNLVGSDYFEIERKNLSHLLGLTQREYNQLQDKVRTVCRYSLDEAENEWEYTEAGQKLVEKSASLENRNESLVILDSAIPSNIPGHDLVDKAKISDFIALVCDIRKSTQRLSTTLVGAEVNGIQRVFYETSALLPVIEITLEHFGGKVTEYLGDGTLGFIKYIDDEQIYAAHKFSKCCLTLSLDIVNELLKERYSLPALQIGIGLAFSKALIRVVTKNHVKAFGECVWRATKLSNGYNKVNIDEKLKAKWPKAIGGGLSFTKTTHDKLTGYRLYPQK